MCVLTLTGCGDSGLSIAELLSRTADSCLLAVRDKNKPYDQIGACNDLRGISIAYFNARGQSPSDKAELSFASARATAWTAVALHNSRRNFEPLIRIW